MEVLDALLSGRKALLVASTGGHLAQLHRLTERVAVDPSSLWVTFDTPQSRSLLPTARTEFVNYIPPRGWRQIASTSRRILQILRSEKFDVIVSTGAGIALASHVVGAIRRENVVYIESVSRVDGPSATGRVLERVPRVKRFAQHAWGQQRRGWRNEFSVLDTFEPAPVGGRSFKPSRIFVTLGTIHPYEFRSLVHAVEDAVPRDAEVVWQLGSTDVSPEHGEAHDQMSAEQFASNVAWADLVISHAGVGTLISLVEAGANVIAVPRRRVRGEHVDDHQAQIAREFSSRGLLQAVEVDDLRGALKTVGL